MLKSIIMLNLATMLIGICIGVARNHAMGGRVRIHMHARRAGILRSEGEISICSKRTQKISTSEDQGREMWPGLGSRSTPSPLPLIGHNSHRNTSFCMAIAPQCILLYLHLNCIADARKGIRAGGRNFVPVSNPTRSNLLETAAWSERLGTNFWGSGIRD